MLFLYKILLQSNQMISILIEYDNQQEYIERDQ